MSKTSVFNQRHRNRQYQTRFLKVLKYITFCYQQQLANKVIYSKSYCKQNTVHGDRFEEYLTEEFVDNYLLKYKNQHQSFEHEKVTFEFRNELQDKYANKQGKIKHDKIDIAVTGIIEKEEGWDGTPAEKIYYAIECKRLNVKNKNGAYDGKANEYVKDIDKLTQSRVYTHRFPFNGMIGYVEKPNSEEEAVTKINSNLEKHTKIITLKHLDAFDLKDNFQYCKYSEHYQEHIKNQKSIYHLFFDYSLLITD